MFKLFRATKYRQTDVPDVKVMLVSQWESNSVDTNRQV